MPEPTELLDALIGEVVKCLVGFGQFAPDVYTYDDRDGPPEDITWYVDISPAIEELVGGQHDGAEGYNGFTACVSGIMSVLEPPETPEGPPGTSYPPMTAPHVEFLCELHEPPHLSVEGRYKGLNVVVQVFSELIDNDEDDEDLLDEMEEELNG